MSESFPDAEHPFRRTPDGREYLENHHVFDYARDYQKEFDKQRFEDPNDAIQAADRRVGILDKMARDGSIMHEIATLIGPNVYVPVSHHDKTSGAVVFRMRNSHDMGDEIADINGEFFGFTAFATPAPTANGEYFPTLGMQVLLRHYRAPSFQGHLLAFGPVATTAISFVDDTLKRAMNDGLF